MRKCLVMALLLGSSAFSFAVTNVTGTLRDASGAAVTSRTVVRFTIRGCGGNQPRVSGTGVVVPSSYEFTPDASGNIAGTLYSSVTEIECGGQTGVAWYGVQVIRDGKAGPEVAYAVTGASFDLDSAAPLTTNPVVAAPTGDSTYVRLDGGNNPSGALVPAAAGLDLGASGARWDVVAQNVDLAGYVDGTAGAAPGNPGSGFRYYSKTGAGWCQRDTSGTETCLSHNMLSSSHTDSTPAAVQRGDLITGQGVSATWSRLAKGGSGTYLRSDGTDVAWSTMQTADLPMVDCDGAVTCVMSSKMWLAAAGCNGGTPSAMWDTPVSNPAVAACVTGTNIQKGVLDFANGASALSAQTTLLLPTDFSGAIDARIRWTTSATSGDVVWQIASACAGNDVDDPAFNTASTVQSSAGSPANKVSESNIANVTSTGCDAGELLHVKITRDPAHAADSLAAAARLIGVEVTIRRTM